MNAVNTPKLAIAMNYIDDELISGAIDYKPMPIKLKWLRYATVAACVMFVCTAAFRFAISFIGNQATDIYRVGDSLVITNIEDIPGKYNGDLLAENLDFTSADEISIELYFDDIGAAENSADWYSLLIAADYSDYEMTMYCLFDNTKSLEDWKVSSVFTPEATQTVNINGTDVLIARRDVALDNEYSYYAIFEYQDVVYDVRVDSINADSIYTVLNDMLSDPIN